MNRIAQGYLLLVLLTCSCTTWAKGDCEQWIAKLASGQGKVDIQHPSDTQWLSVKQEEIFCPGDKIRTGKRSRATLLLSNQTLVTLDQNSTLIFSQPEEENIPWLLKLLQGSGFFRSRQTQQLNIHTPFINAVHEGTEFLVEVDATQTQISVFDGQVAAQNELGKISIRQGFTGLASANHPPHIQALTIKPEDAVQWSLYYPPIIDDSSGGRFAADNNLIPALEAYRQGHSFQSLAALDAVPAEQHNVHYLTLKAALLLTVGRVDEAEPLINQAQQLEPTSSDAYAIKAVIAVAKNQQQQALEWANQAVTANPESSIAKIAQSYAYQSLFNIDEALKSTQAAVRLAPDNALAWARLTELHLSMSDQDAALLAAQKSSQLNPHLARTQTLTGFANLARTNIERAKEDFEQALALDSSDPLARLGLGLSKIRKGDIEAGKTDLETAVNLDPNNSVLRSYLGKAYYELRNSDFASTEFKIAKEMDPKDPTPWFYDAILKQTTNRPVEALHDMQHAIELNDNRGVYRSRLLLDEDLAARSASLGRIYNDLGFQELGLLEGWKSVNIDPTNFSAHRLMADNYSVLPRHEIAKVSESLQTQLLQPINITPVLPQMAETNLKNVDHLGPGSLSLNEFNPLFARNGVALRASGIAGSQNSLGDEVILSGLWNQFSINLSQFHYQTDGYRTNDHIKQNLYSAFTQIALTPSTSVQLELRKKSTEYGDIAQRINNFHRPNYRDLFDEETIRGGLKFSPNKSHTVLSSFIYKHAKQHTSDNENFDTLTIHNDDRTKSNGYQLESQYLFHGERFNLISGAGYSNQPYKQNNLFQATEEGELIFVEPFTVSEKIEYHNFYAYTPIVLTSFAKMTLGLSVDTLNQSEQDQTRINPKVGLILNPTDWTTLRYASFSTMKRPVLSNQTLEPTQVAGFNQFFDDTNGTFAWRHGIGLDQRLSTDLFGGVELTKRTLTGGGRSDRDEYYHRSYLNWTPTVNLVLSAEYGYENIKRDYVNDTQDSTNPAETLTHTLPLSVAYFMESGLFAKVTSTYVNQKVDFVAETSGTDRLDSQFWNTDFSIGYRLPKRYGLIKLSINNIFNHKFDYQSPNSGTGEPLSSPYQPERFISSTINLAF
ncbi:FecR domain-containing protein [Methylicorpusculum oleiharenae]|uniref:FecR domain-containing protein n=1 Tax=Methylicorpusculum oleiharenae TaxID=1338687 RepID=UPI001358F5DB|nr:FecR domain-containing protein [Methylicorpusculum oleiharenae]MCD2453313.1 FecR domain-containing protein [Methylicorpusculum oleiharenae]